MQSQEIKNAKVKVHTPDLAKDKKKQLTVTFFVGGNQVDEITPEQAERMANKLSKTMSIYYTAHAEEYQKMN